MLVKIILPLAFCLLAGCAPKRMLVKNGISQEQVARDNAECRLESMKATIGESQNLFVGLDKNNAYVYCLQAKGYN